MGLFQHLFTERKVPSFFWRSRVKNHVYAQCWEFATMSLLLSLSLSPMCLMFKHTPYWEAKLAKICLTLSSWCALAKSTGVKPLAFLALNSALAERSCSTRVTWPEKNPNALWGTLWDMENPTVFGALLQTSILLFNASIMYKYST